MIEEDLHIGKRIDRNADLSDLALSDGIRGIVADLRREIKRAGKPRRTAFDEVTIALVGFLRCGEARVHTHGPEAPAVHRRLNATGIGINAGETEILRVVRLLDVERGVKPLRRNVRARGELCGCLLYVGIVLVKLRLDFLIAHLDFFLLCSFQFLRFVR